MHEKKDYVYKSNYAYIILDAMRPGAITFMTRLEYEYFPPDNEELSDLFTVHFMKHMGQPYVVVGVPFEYLEKCRKLADQNCLKIVSGTPVITNIFKDQSSLEPKIEQYPFPIHHSADLIFTIENLKTYETPEKVKNALMEERMKVEDYIRECHS